MNDQLAGPIPPYAYLWLAFSIWMIIDAVRRRAPSYWYFVIVVLPFGALIYFLFVKMRDFQRDPNKTEAASPPTTSASSFPSLPFVGPKVSLDQADRLEEAERYAEAEPVFRQALEVDANNKQALHGLGRCLAGRGLPKESLPFFERLLELDREYRNYGAGLDYADALWAADQRADTLELLERLADMSGRVNHRLALGYYLAEAGQVGRAKLELRRAVDEASKSPEAQAPRVRQWIERGKTMLDELEQDEPSEPSLH